MLLKSYRLTRSQILKLRHHGRKIQSTFFSLIFLPNQISHLRLSVEIATRIDKRATFRNKIRRGIYTSLQRSPILLRPLDVLVVLKPTKDKQYPLAAVQKLIESLQ